jgi:hypothetical protein
MVVIFGVAAIACVIVAVVAVTADGVRNRTLMEQWAAQIDSSAPSVEPELWFIG